MYDDNSIKLDQLIKAVYPTARIPFNIQFNKNLLNIMHLEVSKFSPQ